MYVWTNWQNYTHDQTIGTIELKNKQIMVRMSFSYPPLFQYISDFSPFLQFDGITTIPNKHVPMVTLASTKGSQSVVCFSEPVTNPVLLLSSLGSVNSKVTLRFSEPYIPLHNGGGTTFFDSFTLLGAEGNAVVEFPGTFTCITITADKPEFYTLVTWGALDPYFPVYIANSSNQCGSLTLTASGGTSYQWSGGRNPSSATNTVTTTGVYSVTATNQAGCKVATLKNIQSIPKTTLTSTVNKTICQGESYLGYTTSGRYVDSLKTMYDCDSLRTLQLTVLEKPRILLGNQKEICQGQSTTLNPIIPSGSSSIAYQWSTGESTANIAVTQAGVYTLTVVSGICSSTTSTSVTVQPLPRALADEVRSCDNPILSADGLDSTLTYLWEPSGETASTIQIHQPGTYKVRLTNSFGCSLTRTIQITGACPSNAFAPDSFTPNGDQINDRFRLFVTNGSQIRLTIYNRWGDVVYSEESANPQWNGQLKGEDCPIGTYSYSLFYKPMGSNEVLEHRGSVLLIR
ncbi:gliding motility-associated C-terminal domain-containing protein [Spirosoma sp. 48-14]|uniref:T9SS type B sorting domain-containing protein n=1 Tax=Spirosoma sp. 48-14 TaxID=1895854 RepID=UPI0025D5B55B|nr:gliding motility-associated C-terminal domain-containing protein [Spirosoma sp. 48-14]